MLGKRLLLLTRALLAIIQIAMLFILMILQMAILMLLIRVWTTVAWWQMLRNKLPLALISFISRFLKMVQNIRLTHKLSKPYNGSLPTLRTTTLPLSIYPSVLAMFNLQPHGQVLMNMKLWTMRALLLRLPLVIARNIIMLMV